MVSARKEAEQQQQHVAAAWRAAREKITECYYYI